MYRNTLWKIFGEVVDQRSDYSTISDLAQLITCKIGEVGGNLFAKSML